jgi:carbonic anhydrase
MKKLIQGLHQFQSGYFQSHKDLFEQLSHGQHPRILFITCSDSRIDPNLITQAAVGELFVIRNAGNIVPPFGATNGGEGATIEYAMQALDIRQVIICGHSHCGAMKGLLKLDQLAESMPLVHDWLKYAEATRRLLIENYGNCQTDDLADIAVAENVLSQLENLHTYPTVRSKLHRGELSLHGWIYHIETGEILAYDSVQHDFVAPQSRLPAPEPEYNLHRTCPIPGQQPFQVPQVATPVTPQPKQVQPVAEMPGRARLSPEQMERIYRGSR